MKKLSLILALIMLISCALVGCTLPEDELDGIKVITTAFVGYDLARQVGGDDVNVSLLLPVGAESHTYEPTPRDIINISKCDLFIYVGGESESWVDELLNDDIKPKMMIKMMDLVELLTEEHDHDHDHDIGKTAYDEHVWTSPKNTLKLLDAVNDALTEIDATKKEAFESNYKKYRSEIEVLDNGFREFFATFEKPTLVFGDRFPLSYFAHEYGIDHYSAFHGCSSESEPSAQVVASLIDKVKTENIPAVFYIELSNHKVADTIAEATGARTALFNTCHNVTLEQFESGEGYVSLMKKNLETLKEVLG
ncbi:MAG: zinc ABC transporter substrate-binding protein [Clostridia bacterium]|nr:zinc ABC transporter substrate-binding protein [Clostridia bacterium]